jgi:flagellin
LLSGALAYQASSIDTSQLAHTSIYAARITEGGTKRVVVEVQSAAELAQMSFGATTTSAVTVELSGRMGTDILSFQSGSTQAEVRDAINSITDATGIRAAVSGGSLVLVSTEYGSDAFVSVRSINGTFMGSTITTGSTQRDDGFDPNVMVNGQRAYTSGLQVDTRTQGLEARFYLTSGFAVQTTTSTFYITGGGALFQITPQVNLQGQLHMGIESTSTANLGNTITGFLSDIRSGGVYEVARRNFIAAENIITEAINQVSSQRGRMGAAQKQKMETNISSQQIAFENVTASESAIRDADYATEVSALTRDQILLQANSMTLNISQQVPQTALSLLNG